MSTNAQTVNFKQSSNTNAIIGVPDRAVISSTGITRVGASQSLFKNLGAKIVNLNGYDMLKFEIQPNASIITNQDTMSYMDGGLTTVATVGSTGFFGAILRGVTGSSMLQNKVENLTPDVLTMTLSPLLQGSIIQVDIRAGETWRFADRTFLACTPNLGVTGNVNIFSNFKMIFVGQDVTFVQIFAKDTDGTVWISAHGACETHMLPMGIETSKPFFINNGCFLGMLSNKDGINYYKDYVKVGLPSSLFQSVFTDLGFVMKIQDSKPVIRPGPIQCLVLTQSLNPHNLEKFIHNIAEQTARQVMNSRIAFSGGSPSIRQRNVTRKSR